MQRHDFAKQERDPAQMVECWTLCKHVGQTEDVSVAESIVGVHHEIVDQTREIGSHHNDFSQLILSQFVVDTSESDNVQVQRIQKHWAAEIGLDRSDGDVQQFLVDLRYQLVHFRVVIVLFSGVDRKQASDGYWKRFPGICRIQRF
ncbi:hypothetical protein OGAPHI_007126 [Ogataea philodendri]|uniref:Uncharacterized protein n=1 Tax=Ogataea philodendri TaxID=1378263 RepID=A0A9P8NVM5_9ASCO|nr:uncharacterized protein OGAPHI_007126 [Ogataea philodendri]KAH3660540.1 hypothetical protein OGAPHI_007126 [Ogataea philodendri]